MTVEHAAAFSVDPGGTVLILGADAPAADPGDLDP
jgi:hypothetical protein